MQGEGRGKEGKEGGREGEGREGACAVLTFPLKNPWPPSTFDVNWLQVQLQGLPGCQS